MVNIATIQGRAERLTRIGITIRKLPHHLQTICHFTIYSYSIHIATIQGRVEQSCLTWIGITITENYQAIFIIFNMQRQLQTGCLYLHNIWWLTRHGSGQGRIQRVFVVDPPQKCIKPIFSLVFDFFPTFFKFFPTCVQVFPTLSFFLQFFSRFPNLTHRGVDPRFSPGSWREFTLQDIC